MCEPVRGGFIDHACLVAHEYIHILTHTIHVSQDEFLPEDDCRRIVAACETAVESDAFITSQQV